jgi:branched-chain amino acid transport system ATP-binding protein
MKPLLEAEKLFAGYGASPAIRDVNLEVAAGEVVLLIGPNGAGKSTTLHTLAGDLFPSDGCVRWEGQITKAPMYKRARQGLRLITEGQSTFGDLTTRDNLRLGVGSVDGAVDLFPELTPLLSRPARLLSRGEQQMLTVGRALSSGPKLLMADELSLGLAPLIVERLLEAIKRAATTASTGVLLVEQHVRQALKIADRGYLMRRGRIVLSGTVDELERRLPEIEAAYLVSSNP